MGGWFRAIPTSSPTITQSPRHSFKTQTTPTQAANRFCFSDVDLLYTCSTVSSAASERSWASCPICVANGAGGREHQASEAGSQEFASLFFGFQEPRRVRRLTEPVRREIPLPARHGEAHRGSSSPWKAVVRRGVCFRPRHALVESLRRKIHGEESPEIVCIQTNFLRLFRIYINNRN